MPPRKEYGEATRRSARLRSASVSESGDQGTARTIKPAIPRKAASRKAAPWDAGDAVERILAGDRQYFMGLTKAQGALVVDEISARLTEVEATNETLRRERDAALSRARIAESLRNKTTTPPPPSAISAAPPPESGPSSPSSPPAPVDVTETTFLPEEESTPAPAWRTYLSKVGGILSPFKRTAATKRSAPAGEDDAPTPAKKARVGDSPRRFHGPAAKNSGVQTSLVTITEITEASSSSAAAETPSKVAPPPRVNPPAATPAPVKEGPNETSAATPLSPSTHPSMASPTPTYVDTTGPRQRRTIASVRARRAASNAPSRAYSWERQATPKPNERNADRRLEKLQEYKSTKQRLQELAQDADVIEIESHRRKRVKVDDLEIIPHNLPGDSASTFRVPDWDSDEEMEVDENVPEVKNVFSMQAAQQAEQQKQQHIEQQQAQEQAREPSSIVDGMSYEMQHPSLQELESEQEETIDFGFPSVGSRLPEHDITEEESEECGNMFTAGFNAFLAKHNGYMGEHGYVLRA